MAADDAAARIAQAVEPDSLIIPIISDIHVRGTDDPHFCALCDALAALRAATHVDALIGLGDWFAMLGREEHIATARVSELLTEFSDRARDAVGVPAFFINGNHDGIGTDFFSPTLWHAAVGARFDGGLAHFHGDSAYFYVDYPAVGARKCPMRLIFLSTPCDSSPERVPPTPHWALGEPQLHWLEDVALDVPENANVIVFSHVPFNSYYADRHDAWLPVWNGHAQVNACVSALSGWLDDRSGAERILNDFVYCRGRFMNRPHAVLRAAIAGHEHYDALFAPGERQGDFVNQLPCPQVFVASTNPAFNPLLRESAHVGVSIDVMVCSDSHVRLIRFGDGRDRILA